MNIGMLGNSMAGKTNYINTQFEQLKILNPNYNISLSILDSDGSIEKYRFAYDNLWEPYKKGQPHRFCRSTFQSSLLHYVIQLNYSNLLNIYTFDYAGERTGEISEQDIYPILSNCDIVFVFLDSKILDSYIDNKYTTKNDKECIEKLGLNKHVEILNKIKKVRIDKSIHVSLILTKIDAVSHIEEDLVNYANHLWNSEIAFQSCQKINRLGTYASTIIGKKVDLNSGQTSVSYINGEFVINPQVKLQPQNILTPLFDSIYQYAYYCHYNQERFEKESKSLRKNAKESIIWVLKNIGPLFTKIFLSKETYVINFVASCLLSYHGYKKAKEESIIERILEIDYLIKQIKDRKL